jgi:hypothetical protein
VNEKEFLDKIEERVQAGISENTFTGSGKAEEEPLTMEKIKTMIKRLDELEPKHVPLYVHPDVIKELKAMGYNVNEDYIVPSAMVPVGMAIHFPIKKGGKIYEYKG